MAKTLFDKIWEAHEVAPGLLYIDLHMVHEVTSAQAFEGLRLAGRTVRRPDRTLATADHNTPTDGTPVAARIADELSRVQVQTLERNCAQFGIPIYSLGSDRQGIVHVTGGAAHADLPQRAQDQVLGGHAEAELAFVANAHRARLSLHHALRREHVLDLARADAERECPEGAVGGGVRIAAHHRHAGLGDAQLGPDHVHDALAIGAQRVDRDPELRAVALERLNLHARELVSDPRRHRGAVGRRVVIGGRKRAVGPAHRASGEA